MSRYNYFNRGKLGVSNSRGMDPNLKIVNARTGEIYDSVNEENTKKELEKQGINLNDINFEDPYITLLKGMELMNDYFQNNDYYVTVEPSALLTLEEIRQGAKVEQVTVRQDGYEFVYANEVKTFLPLMEILKIRSLGYKIQLTRKDDIIPLYRELIYLERVTDRENYPSYNRLPTSPEIVNEIKNLIKDIEENNRWILETPIEEPTPGIIEQNFGTLSSFINDLNTAYNKVNTQAPSLDETGNYSEQITQMMKYRKRT